MRTEAAVCAVIVTYRPDATVLRALLQRLVPQVAHTVVIDNASSIDVAAIAREAGAHCLRQDENLGLAAGFNLGIEWAEKRGASHVLLSDQDSEPAPVMVAKLLAGEARLAQLGKQVAAVGPRFTDIKTGRRNPVATTGWLYLAKRDKPQFETFIEASYLISSGVLLRTSVVRQVGPMREELFIDAIDVEWCLRAARHGLRSYTVEDAGMLHDIGESAVRIGPVMRALHSPLRHYYILRNALLLLRDPQLPWRWKVAELLKSLRRIVAYPLLSKQPLQELKWLRRALWDGLRGRSGKCAFEA
ncbi:MAG TPA: glycosyltransferase family 2 protein [Burkholderiaceae bacterium]